MPNAHERQRRRRSPAGRLAIPCACAALWLAAGVSAHGQTASQMTQILERLDRLEEQNRQLMEQVRALREQLAAARGEPASASAAGAGPSVEERLQVQESRTAEQAQSKVEAAHKFPIRITGMALFNTYLNSGGSGGAGYPTVAAPGGTRSGGATLRQTILGLDYTGPRTVWNGKVSGTLRLDLFGGGGQILDQEVRLRTGTLRIDWKDRSILAGVDKPLISPRDPDSLAQVGVSPLTAAGNLWLWLPQARFEQVVHFGDNAGLRAQVALIQTREGRGAVSSEYQGGSAALNVEPVRPGLEARLEFFGGGPGRRIEIAPSLHHSVSHVAETSVSSNVYSLDWLARPWPWLELTGVAFTGQNAAPLGTGPARPGYVALEPGMARPVRSHGGWGQVALRPGERAWFNLFTGRQDDRESDLLLGGISSNMLYGANFFYRLAPNVLASFEASQTRTRLIGTGLLRNNHYDLALAYLF